MILLYHLQIVVFLLFTFSFIIGILMISFTCLIVLAVISCTILKRYGGSRKICLVLKVSGIALSFTLFHLMLAIFLLYGAFIIFTYTPGIPELSNIVNMKGSWVFSKAFSASNEMTMWLSFLSVCLHFELSC